LEENPDVTPNAALVEFPGCKGQDVLRRIRVLFLRVAFVAALVIVLAAPAEAQRRSISFIRDAEIEATIRAYATPLFAAAGLNPEAINVHLVNDRKLNAFVGNGLNMFIHTGLLMRSEHAGQVIGVIAHETGHIQGGHLLQMREQISQAMIPMLLEMLMTMGAGAAGGRGGNPNDWGGVTGGGGPSITERMLLRYSRGMENQADQAALTLLDRTGQSARGLMEFLDVIADQELLSRDRQSPYVVTHPISRERVETVRNHVARSRLAAAPIEPRFAEMHRRMRAKLYGFLEPGRVAVLYKPEDNSIEARYAHAIAAYKRLDFVRSTMLLDSLIRERPNDPFFLETKAQFLLEQGKAAEARPIYARAAALAPKEALLVQALGSAELQAGDARAAIATLERARRLQPEDADTWRILARAYAQDNQLPMADYAQAESFAIIGRAREAYHFAERALRGLPPNSPAWLRAQDIKATNERRRQ
jgi:predicted Zn-dependent protease